MTTPAQRTLGDPQRLKALAHPIRLDLLERLRTDGPLTATEAGERIGESSGSTSFHLRQLERYGFVEPVPGSSGRRKPWKLVERGFSLLNDDGTLAVDPDQDPVEVARSGSAVMTMLLQRAIDDAAAWLASAADDTGAWAGLGEVTSRVRVVRPDQLRDLVAEVGAVLDRFEDVTHAEADDVGRVRIAFVAVPAHDRVESA